MKKLFLVANWKSNMTSAESRKWISGLDQGEVKKVSASEKTIIICPPVTLLLEFAWFIKSQKLPFMLGAQDVSPFDTGAYTGEVNARQIKEFADYVLIGHSERRKNFNEDDSLLEKKVSLAIKNSLTPIFCVQSDDVRIPKDVSLVAYEPVFAIGTGNPDTPENAEKVATAIKQKNSNVQFVLYGGSVTKDNVGQFTSKEHIDGVLVGKASLSPLEFIGIIQHA